MIIIHFSPDTLNQTGTSLYRLSYTDISHVCEESIVINDKKPLLDH
jgi:hypothetical protein